MAANNLSDVLRAAQARTGSDLGLLIAPQLLKLPLPIQRFDDPFLPFGKAIIDATHDLVCAYVFDLACYLALGAAGAVALERTIGYAGKNTVTVLHAPFASTAYAAAAGNVAFNVDAVTVTDSRFAPSYIDEGRGAFVVRDFLGADLTESIGVYVADQRGFYLSGGAGTLQILLLGEETLYAGKGDDFAEKVRAAVMGQKN
jgi:orotidine-5'-phosphate decarboxylase